MVCDILFVGRCIYIIFYFFNLLLIRKSSSCGDFGFPFSLFEWPFIMSSTQRITINKMLSALFNLLCMKHFLPSASSKESTASVLILVKCNHLAQMRKDYLVKEMWWNHLDPPPHPSCSLRFKRSQFLCKTILYITVIKIFFTALYTVL